MTSDQDGNVELVAIADNIGRLGTSASLLRLQLFYQADAEAKVTVNGTINARRMQKLKLLRLMVA
jgi:hypothetical protein